MKIIINGCGKIGSYIVKSLSIEGHDITVIDRNPDVVADVTASYDVMGITGNGADTDVLSECGIEDCDLFVSVADTDEINMLSCIFAKSLGAKNTIARIRNPEYNDKSLDYIIKNLEIDVSINPDRLVAKEIYNILKFPSAVKIEAFSKGLEMVEIVLKEDSVLDGVNLIKLREMTGAKVLVCSVKRGDDVIIPYGRFELKSGDRIGITGYQAEIVKFLKSLGLLQKKARNILILGGSRTARYLSEMIINGGSTVKIIEKDMAVCEKLAASVPQATVIHGDGTNHDVLEEEGIEGADAFVALTGVDEENIITSLYASQKSVPKVVVKVNSDPLAKMSENLGLNSVVSAKKSFSDVVVSYARALRDSLESNFETLYQLFDGQVEALEFTAKSEGDVIGVPLHELKLKKNTLIAGIVRNNHVIIPCGEDAVHSGDHVIVISSDYRFDSLDDIAEK